jgi:haloalkane dehalogenase
MQSTNQLRRELITRSLLSATGALSLPHLLTACGGDDNGTATELAPAPATAPTATPPPAFITTASTRFATLADFPYAENYAPVKQMRMHYVDVGPRNAAQTFLCLHGQPTWCYLYRKMIAVFLAAGHRVIAPDWFGFGKSDKPTADATYTFNFHRESMLAFIQQLDLRNVTLVVQDWGGLLGLTLPLAMTDRFTRLIIMNTTFATGEPLDPALTSWYGLSEQRRARWLAMTDVNVPQIMQSASPSMSAQIAQAYDAPFPDPSYEAGARRFPVIVPIRPDEEGAAISREAQAWWGSQWTGKSFMAIGMQDNLLGPDVMNVMQKLIRNCPEPMRLAGAGHFIQEDAGDIVAQAALAALGV